MSILGDDILDTTDYEFGFPEKTDMITDWGNPYKTKYYIWESPLLFAKAINCMGDNFYNKGVFTSINSIIIAWSLSSIDNIKEYILRIYISPNNKAEFVDGDCTSKRHYICLTSSKFRTYSERRAKTLSYKLLSAIKDDPSIMLKFVQNPWPFIEDVI